MLVSSFNADIFSLQNKNKEKEVNLTLINSQAMLIND